MEYWRLIDLGMAEPLKAQTLYEAVAWGVEEKLSPNTILIVQPSSPYVCIGYHQELEREIDIDYCRRMGLPIIRRGQGGGATYLNSDQIFYQIVARDDGDVIPLNIEELFKKFLSVTVYVYRKLGVPAEYKPINDVVVKGKKISGNGAGKYGLNTTILVGNVILDLDYDSMAKVLRVPSEKFRDKMAKSMREWVTSLRRELGYTPSVDRIKELLIEGYRSVLGLNLTPSYISEEEMRFWSEKVKPKHESKEWLYMPEFKHKALTEGRSVKIAGGINLVEVDHKAKKLIRIRAEIVEDKISDIMITGDFFLIPENEILKLEAKLTGSPLEYDAVMDRIKSFYDETDVQTPGLTPKDFADAIMKIKDMLP